MLRILVCHIFSSTKHAVREDESSNEIGKGPAKKLEKKESRNRAQKSSTSHQSHALEPLFHVCPIFSLSILRLFYKARSFLCIHTKGSLRWDLGEGLMKHFGPGPPTTGRLIAAQKRSAFLNRFKSNFKKIKYDFIFNKYMI